MPATRSPWPTERLALVCGCAFALAGAPSNATAQMAIPYLADEPPPPEATPEANEPGKAPQPVESDEPAGGGGVDSPVQGNRAARAPVDGEAAPSEAAQPDGGPPPAQPETSRSSPDAVWALWSRRRAALQANDAALAQQLLTELLEIKRQSGWPNMFAIADALARESVRARAQGQAGQAVVLATAAVELAPDRPVPHLALARAALSKGGMITTAVGETFESYGLSWTEPPQRRARLGNALIVLLAGALLAACLFALAILYRHARILVHDMHHLVPRGATRLQTGVLGIAVLLAPVFFRLGVALTVLWWVTLMGIYYRRRERVAAILVLALLAAIPLLLPVATAYLAYAGSRAEAVYLASRDIGAAAAVRSIEDRADPLADELYVLGMRARWSGQSDRAADLLSRAERAGATDAQLLIELGNIRFEQDDKPGAIAYYEKATRVAPDNVVAHFNLYRSYNALAEARKGGQAHQRAQAVDYDMTERLGEAAKRRGPDFVASEPLPSRLLDIDVPDQRDQHRAVTHLWRLIGGKQLPRYHFAAAALAALVLTVLMGGLRGIFKPSRSCARCGRAACVRCNPEMPNQHDCGQCYHAFVAKEDVDPQVRIKKEIEVHRYQARTARVRRIISLVVAGAGQVLRGSSLRGLAFLATFFTSLLFLGLAVGLIPEPVPTLPNGRWLSVTLAVLAALASYGLGLWDMQKRER